MVALHPAYIAGLADSDGSFTITIRHKNRPTVNYFTCFQISWKVSDRTVEVFNTLKEQFGGSVCVEKKQRLNGLAGKPRPLMARYMCQGKHLESFLKEVTPFLTLKKEQAELCLKLRNIASCGYKIPRPKEITDLQHSLYLQMNALNSKNVKGGQDASN